MQVRAIRLQAQGGPEVMQLQTIDVPAPGPGQALVRHTAIGVNYIDVYHRSGLYPMPVPMGCGTEGAGVIEALGPDTMPGYAVGDRVAYAGGDPGSYAEARLFPVARLVKIPAGVTDEQAAASMLKGMTTEYLLNRTVSLKRGDHALMYAAAGGVGLFAGQWARHLGVHLIGVAAGAEKCALAMQHGYTAVIDRTKEDITGRVLEITGGKKLPVVFDSVGRATYETTLSVLAVRGMFVSFGSSSGVVPPVDAGRLQALGSLYFTRPTLGSYIATVDDLQASSGAMFKLMADGVLVPQIGHRWKLADAVHVHQELEAGRTSGAIVLTP